MAIDGRLDLEIWKYEAHNSKYPHYPKIEDQAVLPVGIWRKRVTF
jgi:hypothetical protein